MRKVSQRTCKNAECKAKFTPNFPNEIVCSGNCKIKYAIQQGRKKLEAKKKEEQKAFKEKKEAFRAQDPKWVKPKLQTELQAIARTIDQGLPCLATGRAGGQMHGGHVFSKGAHPQMRYNLHNIHRQSAQSNHSHNDDGLLREKLEQEYGTKYLHYLRSLRKEEPVKLSAQELYDKYLQARAAHRALKKGIENIPKPLPSELRIKLREHLNQTLSIVISNYLNHY